MHTAFRSLIGRWSGGHGEKILCFQTVAIKFKITIEIQFFFKKLIFQQLVKKSPHRIEPKSSLPFSEKLAFFPLAEPDESSPRVIILVSKSQINFKIRNSPLDEDKTRFKGAYCLHFQGNVTCAKITWAARKFMGRGNLTLELYVIHV